MLRSSEKLRSDGLEARFGADIALPDVLTALATCERRRDFSRPCGARFTDLTSKTAGTNDGDDPNGRMKAARDAMNKTVEFQSEIRSS